MGVLDLIPLINLTFFANILVISFSSAPAMFCYRRSPMKNYINAICLCVLEALHHKPLKKAPGLDLGGQASIKNVMVRKRGFSTSQVQLTLLQIHPAIFGYDMKKFYPVNGRHIS